MRTGIKCGVCEVIAENQDELDDHIVNNHTYKCDECSYKSFGLLAAHKKTNHKKPLQTFSCNTCGKNFPLENDLKNHTCNHTMNQKTNCDQCDFVGCHRICDSLNEKP